MIRKTVLLLVLAFAFAAAAAEETASGPFTQEALIEALMPERLLETAPLVAISRSAEGEDGPGTLTTRWQLEGGVHYYQETTEYPTDGTFRSFCLSDDPEDSFIYHLDRDGTATAVPFDREGFPILFCEDVLQLGELEPESYAADALENGLWQAVYEGISDETGAVVEWTLLYDPATCRFLSAVRDAGNGEPEEVRFLYEDAPGDPVRLARDAFAPEEKAALPAV